MATLFVDMARPPPWIALGIDRIKREAPVNPPCIIVVGVGPRLSWEVMGQEKPSWESFPDESGMAFLLGGGAKKRSEEKGEKTSVRSCEKARCHAAKQGGVR